MWDFASDHYVSTLLIVIVMGAVTVSPFFFAFLAYNQTLRSRNIIARGWPPPHLDADGDFAKEDDEEEEEAGQQNAAPAPQRLVESPAR